MARTNVYQVADWNGTSGERWVANQVRLDAMLDAFGEAAIVAADPRAGESVLDVGCGAGASTAVLAQRVGPRGRVLGVDISVPLIERARTLLPPELPASFAVADAGSAALPGALDLLYSRFGVMFFDDPVAAFTHMRGALKRGGRLAFVCWRSAAENDWVRLPMGAIRDLVPPSPAPAADAPGPFSFGDRERVAAILRQAGFSGITIEPFDRAIPFGQGASRAEALDDAVRLAFEVGPLSRALADAGAELRAQAAEATHAAFARKPGEQAVLIDGAAWIVTARNA